MMKRKLDDWYTRLLQAITSAQSQLIGAVESDQVFEGLLSALLELCDSEYGFIGETHHDEDGSVYVRTHAITNIAWNDYTRRYYEENAQDGLEFHNLKTLFGHVMTEEKPVIANAPSTDPRRGGLPEGHPALNCFLGLPLHSAGRLIGMAGVANRPGGYDEKLVDELAPFLQACSNAIFALRADAERREAEGELNNKQRRLQAILDSAFEAIITIDENGIIESANRRAEEMFGYPESSMLGENVSFLMPPPYRHEHDDYIRNYCQTGQAKVIGKGREVLGRHQDGEDFPIHLTIAEVHVDKRRLFTGLIRDLSESKEVDRRLRELQSELERNRFGHLIGRSAAMRYMYQAISDVAQGDWTVLIEGETGTGKELVARAIHAASSRSDGPFVAVNCAALNDSLLGSQLFGHRRGAFTGAVRDQAGYFQAASGGTLFLDEIGDVSKEVQTSLLRALEGAEVVAIGDTKARQVDIRILAATNRNLPAEVESGAFREDLLYRLRVGRIMVPPLRDRKEDVSLLAEAFLAQIRVASGKAITSIADETMATLRDYGWPGNVRELRSAIQYAAINCHSGTIGLRDLPPEIQAVEPSPKRSVEVERDFRARLAQALEKTGGNRTRAAKMLGISRATLYRRINELGAP
jgi:PAS domain S-box-containing protein